MSETFEQQVLIDSPGQRLKLAREEKGWEEADVADRLNLSRQHIMELERDDYHLAPGLTYVRGYLRNYARLVGLPETEIIRAFESLGLTETKTKGPCVTITKATKPRNYRWVRWISLVVAGTLFLLVMLWLGQTS